MKRPLILFLCVFAFALGMFGCSGHVGFSGKVVYSDNGEPVPMGEVQLKTPTFVARAPLRSDGTFTVGSYTVGDGLPPGTYKVGVASYDPDNNLLVDPKYVNPETSDLVVTIDKTTRAFEIKVDRPPATKK